VCGINYPFNLKKKPPRFNHWIRVWLERWNYNEFFSPWGRNRALESAVGAVYLKGLEWQNASRKLKKKHIRSHYCWDLTDSQQWKKWASPDSVSVVWFKSSVCELSTVPSYTTIRNTLQNAFRFEFSLPISGASNLNRFLSLYTRPLSDR
jgi:hypothetical protein